MTIGANALIDFYNANTTQLEETGGSAAVVDDGYSLFDATDMDDYTHADDSPFIIVWLQMNSGGTPAVGSGVNLKGRIMNVTDVPGTTDTNDSPIPTANYPAIHLGRFLVKDTTNEQFIPLEVYLPNTEAGTVWQFGVHVDNNGAGIDAGWGLHVRAKTGGPHA